MLLNSLKELRSEMHSQVRDAKYKIFITDIMTFLLEEATTIIVHSPDQLLLESDTVAISLHMDQEYMKYSTIYPLPVDLTDALKRVAYVCELYDIDMKVIEDYEICYNVPIELALGDKEFDLDIIRGIIR